MYLLQRDVLGAGDLCEQVAAVNGAWVFFGQDREDCGGGEYEVAERHGGGVVAGVGVHVEVVLVEP